MSCSWLFAGSHNLVPASQHFFHLPNCTSYTGWICRRSRTVQRSGQGLWRVLAHTIMSWAALYYQCEKRLVVLFKLLRQEQGLNNLPRIYTWCMVGTYKASTCAGECLFTGCSLRPNHPEISGAWIAPARWPIVVNANQGNTSSII